MCRQDPGLLARLAGPTGTRSSGCGTGRRSRGPDGAPTSGSSSPRPNWSAWPRRVRACCSPSTTCTTPTTAACACCTTSPGRRAASGCASCSRTARFRPRARWRRPGEASSTGTARPSSARPAHRPRHRALVRRYVTDPPAELVKLVTTLSRASRSWSPSSPGGRVAPGPDPAGKDGATGQDWAQALQASMSPGCGRPPARCSSGWPWPARRSTPTSSSPCPGWPRRRPSATSTTPWPRGSSSQRAQDTGSATASSGTR